MPVAKFSDIGKKAGGEQRMRWERASRAVGSVRRTSPHTSRFWFCGPLVGLIPVKQIDLPTRFSGEFCLEHHTGNNGYSIFMSDSKANHENLT